MDQYFAENENVEELAGDIIDRVENYVSYIMASGRAQLWSKSYKMFYQGASNLGELGNAGEHNEFVDMKVNHYKSLMTNLHTITTNQKPALDPRATNTDTESTAQTKLAGGLLDYYFREKKVGRYLKDAVKYGLLYGEGFVLTEWNATSGEEYGVNPETKAIIREGDLEFQSLPPHFVARDYTKQNADKHNWYITTTFENKFDLAAKYPEQADKIKMLSINEEDFIKLNLPFQNLNDAEDVQIFTFYHKPTEALPDGRMVQVLSSDLVVFDGPLPYRELPVYRLAPEDEDFSTFGYSVGFDLLSLQDAINNLYSTIATNQSTFGVQNILIPRGFNISVNSLTGGLNVIEYDPSVGEPKALNLTLTAPEVFNFVAQLEKLMETLSGVNSVSRGNPESSLKSGAALALVQSMAIQFNSNLQQSYVELIEDVGTSIINILKDFAEVPRVAMITGKYNRSYMKDFSGKDLSQINRVVVDAGNPLSKTLAGRIQMAENLLQAGFIKNPDQYQMVMQTGNLDYLLEGDTKELYNIRSENEGLAGGEAQQALITDAHATHIKEHKAVLSSPEARQDPNVIQVVTQHIMEHVNLLKSADPALLQILGQEAIGGAPAPGNPPVMGGPEGIGSELPPEAAVVAPLDNPITQEAMKINPANMPNPPAGTDPRSAAIIEQMKKG